LFIESYMTKTTTPVIGSNTNSSSNTTAFQQAHQCISDQKAKDRPFNGFRMAASEQARALVLDVSQQVQKYESYCRVRQRARRPEDQKVFERQIDALVSDLAYREITKRGAWLTVPFSKRVLGVKDRYRPCVLSKTLPNVIRAMASPEMDFAELELGIRSPFNPACSRQTVIRAGERLRTRIAERQLTTADFRRDKAQEIIILKDTKEDHWDKGRWIPYEDTAQTILYREQLGSINDWLERADIEYLPSDAKEKPVDVANRRLYRYFNNGSFEQGGRLFGGFWQPMNKDQRRYGIVIDGTATVTLDYGQMLPRILYGLAGIDPPFDDAYAIPGMENHRDGVKKVFGSMLHSTETLQRKPQKTASLLPNEYSIAEITAMVMAFHRPVAGAFYAGKGLYLTYLESKILISVLQRLMGQGITALPIHDAVIVPEDKQQQTQTVMLDVFRELTGNEGLVRVEE
jgi:hypothetical protein